MTKLLEAILILLLLSGCDTTVYVDKTVCITVENSPVNLDLSAGIIHQNTK